jgi:hypothetical protein
MKHIFIFIFTFATTSVFAQLEKTIHQTFNMTDAQNIIVNIPNGYELQSWPGDAMLIETTVKLENATKAILDYVVESGRYKILLQDQGTGSNFNLVEQNTNRAKLTTKNGLVNETVSIKIFVPENFDINNKNQIFKKS